ncbi:MAG: HAD family hydrolase [Actinomycetota bacterium]
MTSSMTSSMTFRAVTFDCWGTLISEHDSSTARSLRVAALAEALDVETTDAAGIFQSSWQEHFDAWHRHEQFGATGMVAWIAQRYDLSSAKQQQLLQVFEEITLDVGVNLVDGASETLHALKSANIATALICDTGLSPGRVVRTLLERHGVGSMLDAFAFSDEVGVPKPHPKMFATALDAIGGGPAMHVGDLRRTDVFGARSAGLRSVRFRGVYDDDSDHPEADHVIDDLRTIPELLGLPAA